MSSVGPTLHSFFVHRLAQQRAASPHTVAAYRDTFRLLLMFSQQRISRKPSDLTFDDVDAELVGAFLEHTEKGRGNSVRTRNARLAAIHSFFAYAALNHPEHAGLIERVLAIPHKRHERALVTFLEPPELEAILGAPDQATPVGRRDHALLLVAAQTGLRQSELTGLHRRDVQLDASPYIRCQGKCQLGAKACDSGRTNVRHLISKATPGDSMRRQNWDPPLRTKWANQSKF